MKRLQTSYFPALFLRSYHRKFKSLILLVLINALLPFSKKSILKLPDNKKCIQNFYSGAAVDADKAKEEFRPLLGCYAGYSGKNSFFEIFEP